jgi:CheY-like chemotaxis protein
MKGHWVIDGPLKQKKYGERNYMTITANKNSVSDNIKSDKNSLKKLLLVDDDQRFVDMFSRFLKKEDCYDIIACTKAGDVIEFARKYRPDLIILDVVMPGKGGEELINDLRDDEITTRIPVLFLTGLLQVSECDNAIKKIGSCYFMAKSTPSNIMLELIRQKVYGPSVS